MLGLATMAFRQIPSSCIMLKAFIHLQELMLTSTYARQEILELTENAGAAASEGGQSDDLEHPPLAAGTCFDFHRVWPRVKWCNAILPCEL